MIWAGPVFQGAEWNRRPFFESQNIGMIQRADLGDSKSASLIPDQGLFCGCPVSNGTFSGSLETRLRIVNSLPTASFVSRIEIFLAFLAGEIPQVTGFPGESSNSGRRVSLSGSAECASF
jgi:hypothetical protein